MHEEDSADAVFLMGIKSPSQLQERSEKGAKTAFIQKLLNDTMEPEIIFPSFRSGRNGADLLWHTDPAGT